MLEHTPGAVTQPRSFREQFARPTGFWGQIAGYLMALTNQPVNRLVCQFLDVQPHDRVLEIGFGPGRLIELLAPLVPQGLVAGVDPSEVMVRQATRRNAAWIRAGRVALLHGTVAALPWRDREFSKACAVNSFYFWPRPLEDLREVRRVLHDGGRLVICVRRHEPGARLRLAPGLSDRAIEEIRTLMEAAGFWNVGSDTARAGRQAIALLTGER